jgi:HEPN domain-containing protein
MAVLRDDARRIDRFYIPTRCPNGLPGGTPFETFTREDLRQAVALAERIVASANAIIPNGG